jgi:heat shock protein HtpX
VAANFYLEQGRNVRKTLFLMGGFVLLLGALGYGFDRFYLGTIGPRGGFPWATLLAVALSSAHCLASYLWGDKAVLASVRAAPLNPDNLKHRVLHNIATEMALAGGLPMPRLYCIPDPAPNAFATGRGPDHASIGVTQGLLEMMEREEIQGVIAHEMAHIKNRDVLTMTIVSALLGAVILLSDWARRAFWYGGGRRRDRYGDKGNPLALVLFLVLLVLAPLLSQLLAMAISRGREFLADATAAEFTRNPLGLAKALEKIGKASFPLRSSSRGTAHLFISDPLQRRLDEEAGWFADLMSTHPPLSDRIRRLREMAYAAPVPSRVWTRE